MTLHPKGTNSELSCRGHSAHTVVSDDVGATRQVLHKHTKGVVSTLHNTRTKNHTPPPLPTHVPGRRARIQIGGPNLSNLGVSPALGGEGRRIRVRCSTRG